MEAVEKELVRSSSSSSLSSPRTNVSASRTDPSILDGEASFPSLVEFVLGLTAATPPRHARHGKYREIRGLEEIQLGHMGRLQQSVVNISVELCLGGGREDEQAKQRFVAISEGRRR